MTLEGYDVVGLFPSLESQNTGRIIRNAVLKSDLEVMGFSWQQAARYIALNRQYTDQLGPLEHLLPVTRSGGTKTMKNRGVNSKSERIHDEWIFQPNVTPTESLSRELLARVAEIGLRTIFENFCYQFGGISYIQKKGGPIGNRVTMAASNANMG